jgi:hypothetical protein
MHGRSRCNLFQVRAASPRLVAIRESPHLPRDNRCAANRGSFARTIFRFVFLNIVRNTPELDPTGFRIAERVACIKAEIPRLAHGTYVDERFPACR